MDIYIGRNTMLFTNISKEALNSLIKSNGLSNPNKWPILKTTSHPVYSLPEGIMRRAKQHPNWQLNALRNYRVSTDVCDKQHMTYLWNRDASVFIILFLVIEDDNDDNL